MTRLHSRDLVDFEEHGTSGAGEVGRLNGVGTRLEGEEQGGIAAVDAGETERPDAVERGGKPGRVEQATLDRWHYETGLSAEYTAQDRSAIYGGFHLYVLKA